ncbi:hypothetical protein CG740_37145 [Streptomyces sp. CB01201]|uniref:hypothetical protein n=1 Tax=Streptomyces sp. CB01201 TaxID=2020324 RepID=UPI000C271B67|nr:hypothetical protein [Streptomyces sp. CB01201]PJM98113.1 hypothetical protein CG740_37145 [Streptomyces sp. CB01201]
MADHSTGTPACVAQPTTDDNVRTVLVAIADRLTKVRPAGAMTEESRLARALAHTVELLGYGRDAEEAEHSVIALMPRITRPITRGEYALLLRKIIAGGEEL